MSDPVADIIVVCTLIAIAVMLAKAWSMRRARRRARRTLSELTRRIEAIAAENKS